MRIGLDYGHGVGQDRGANGFMTEEAMIALFGNELKLILEKAGHTIVMLRPASATTVSNSMYQRYTLANNSNLDLVIPIHANAFDAESANGAEILTWKANKDPRAVQVLAKFTEFGFANRGVKDGSSLAMVKSVKAPSLYLELCFCTNQADVNRFNVNYSKMARIVANAIDSKINITEDTDLVCIDTPKVGTVYVGEQFPTIGGWIINDKQEYSLYVNGARCDTKKTWVKRPDVKKVYGVKSDALGFDHGIVTSILKCGTNKIVIKGKSVEKSVDIIYKCCNKCKH